MANHRPSNQYQAYCEVIAHHKEDATILPYRLRIVDADAPKLALPDEVTSLHVDNISNIRQAASQRAGGNGIRYTCTIRELPEAPLFLFHDDEGYWYIEIPAYLYHNR